MIHLIRRHLLVAVLLLSSRVGPLAAQTASPSPDSTKNNEASLRAAKTVRDSADARQQKLQETLKEIEKKFQEWKPGDVSTEKITLEKFKQLLPLLREEAEWLVAKEVEYDTNLKLYKASLEKAPATFQQAAQLFEGYSKNEDDDTLKEHYLNLRNLWKKAAEVYEKRGRTLDDADAAVKLKLKYVKKSVEFLKRVEKHLDAFPDLEKGEEIDKYAKQLIRYIETFEQTIKAFKTFGDQLENKPTKPTPRVEKTISQLTPAHSEQTTTLGNSFARVNHLSDDAAATDTGTPNEASRLTSPRVESPAARPYRVLYYRNAMGAVTYGNAQVRVGDRLSLFTPGPNSTFAAEVVVNKICPADGFLVFTCLRGTIREGQVSFTPRKDVYRMDGSRLAQR